jgi:hypothetical protein
MHQFSDSGDDAIAYKIEPLFSISPVPLLLSGFPVMKRLKA